MQGASGEFSKSHFLPLYIRTMPALLKDPLVLLDVPKCSLQVVEARGSVVQGLGTHRESLELKKVVPFSSPVKQTFPVAAYLGPGK